MEASSIGSEAHCWPGTSVNLVHVSLGRRAVLALLFGAGALRVTLITRFRDDAPRRGSLSGHSRGK